MIYDFNATELLYHYEENILNEHRQSLIRSAGAQSARNA